MTLGFRSSRWIGQHFELAKRSVEAFTAFNFRKKGDSEREFELMMVSALENVEELKKNMITQVSEGEVEKIAPAQVFGFRHWPDIGIGSSGTAIELKVVRAGNSIRDLLGQALVYRMAYRFVVLVIVDLTQGQSVQRACEVAGGPESSFLQGLCDDFSIFTVIGSPATESVIAFGPRVDQG